MAWGDDPLVKTPTAPAQPQQSGGDWGNDPLTPTAGAAAASPPSGKQMTRMERFGTGLLDPVQGGAQLLHHAVPGVVSRYIDDFNNWMADKGVPLAKLPPGGIDEQTREREKQITAETPPGARSLDPYRLAGNIASPVNYAAGPALKAAGPVAQALGMGAASSALEPVKGKDFASEKATQIGTGALTGAATGGIAKVLGGAVAPKVSADTKALLDAGVKLTPGQMAGGATKRAEEAAKSIPITGSSIRRAETEAIDTYNLATANKALEPIGVVIPPGVAGRDIIAQGKSALSNAYNTVVPQLHFQLDPTFATDIAGVRRAFDHMPQQQIDQFAAIQARFRDRLMPNSKSGIGELSGPELQDQLSELTTIAARYKASSIAGERELGDALEQLEDKIHDAVMRQNPAHASQLDAIDKAYAMFVRVEGAAGRRATSDGRFTPGDLLGAIKAQDPTRRKTAFSRGNSLMQDWAQTGHNVISNRLPDSGSPERLMWDVGGGGAAAFMNPNILAGMMGGAAAYTPMGTSLARKVAQPGPRRVAVGNALRQAIPYAAPAAADTVNQERGQ